MDDRRDIDLDLGHVRDDELGADIADAINFGSFAEDESPLRYGGRRSPTDDNEARQRSGGPPRRSPYHHGSSQYHYRRSPRGGGGRGGPSPYPPPPPPHMYYPPYPPHSSPPPNYPRSSPPGSAMRYYPPYPPPPPHGGPYSHYYPYREHSHWETPPPPPPPPPGYAAEHHYEDEPSQPPPPSSSKKRPHPSSAIEHPPSPGRDIPEHNAATPEKPKDNRSPFRSPPQSVGKAKFKRSPFMQPSPHIGTYGSFGIMDTPSGTLGPAEFSPMGPSFTGFGEDESTPLPLGFVNSSTKWGISRSESGDSETPRLPRRSRRPEQSPLTGFMSELSPGEGIIRGVPRSPLRHSTAYPHDDNPPSASRHSPKAPPKGTVTMSANRESSRDRAHRSPIESAQPRKLWPASTPGSAVRVELGGVGSVSARKSLEGINSMIQGHSSSSQHQTPSRSHYDRHPPPPPSVGPYRGDLATPIKPIGHHGPHSESMSRYPPGSADKSPYMGGFPGSTPGSAQKIPPSTGKENKKKSPSGGSKRSPCNCKKSKCLKLYCECFAAERYCHGCNCSDCHNSPAFEDMRQKAMKDTRAKNPNAFKPRIGMKVTTGNSPHGGHNMGCRCKRSECLKKYCECFQAGVICGKICKCVDCLNYAGSQALIDKRRKIKDQRGADFAMRVADEAWKGQPGSSRKPMPGPPRRMQSPSASRMRPHMMPGQLSPRSGRPTHPHYMHHPGMMMGPPPMGGHMGSMGYSPMGMPPMTPGYGKPPHMGHRDHPMGMYPHPPGGSHHHHHHHHHPPPPPSGRASRTPGHYEAASTPRTPAVRVTFDAASSRKKRKLSPGAPEPTSPFFGKDVPEQPKTAALAIFSFLSNDDLYNAGLVCKSWSRLAMDEELWQFKS